MKADVLSSWETAELWFCPLCSPVEVSQEMVKVAIGSQPTFNITYRYKINNRLAFSAALRHTARLRKRI